VIFCINGQTFCILQSFRNVFFQKELDHMNRQQAHADWLQSRHQKYHQKHVENLIHEDGLQRSREVTRQMPLLQ